MYSWISSWVLMPEMLLNQLLFCISVDTILLLNLAQICNIIHAVISVRSPSAWSHLISSQHVATPSSPFLSLALLVLSPARESVSFHIAMLRFPFPSQLVRALHAFAGTPYVFIVQPTKQLLATQACGMSSCMFYETQRVL
jgi:hypothetical protein